MDPIVSILPVVTKGLPISLWFTPYDFYRDASSALLQLVKQWSIFTYSRPHAFRYRRTNTIPALFGENRTHDFRTSRYAGYLLDHSGDELFVCMYVCMYVFIKLHITTQSGPVILVILCHSHVCMYVCIY